MTRTDAVEVFLKECAKHVYNRATGTGVKEVRSNRAPFIDAANRLCNVPLGSPWCASGLAKSGVDSLGTVWPVPLTAACDGLLSWARKRKLLHTSPKRGDLFLVMNPSDDDDATHTGAVTEVAAGRIQTIEFNTNDDGGREGWGCLVRNRPFSSRLLYVRWADVLDDAGPGDEGKPGAWGVVFGSAEKPGKSLPARIENNVAYADFTDYMAAIWGGDAKKMIAWDAEEGSVKWGGNPLPQSIPRMVINGETWVGVRAITLWLGLAVSAVPEVKRIRVYRPEPATVAP